MCRILYALNQPGLKSQLGVFLSHSKSVRFCAEALDGYGFASLSHFHKWSVYKTVAAPHLEDPKLNELIDKISINTLIIGHIRNAQIANMPKRDIKNTHPFYYKNRVFVHNGYLKNAHLQYVRESIYAKISPEFRANIKGHTDSELLFYLFLSVLKTREWIYGDIDMLKGHGCRTPTKFEELRDAVRECFKIVAEITPEYIANFAYADKEYSIVGRLSKNAESKQKRVHPLHIHKSGPGNARRILFSTEPINHSGKMMKWDTFYVINHLSGECREFSMA